ncbi:hypothetical protein [Streptomyces mirabilis]|uniref:hypothetical protein n=1 Tax=Streptomyces mirabilis TaxID=68239 RepID=UPI00365E80FD
MPRSALCVAAVCALSAIAAVVSFSRGGWLVATAWTLSAGLTSNMAWYYRRPVRSRATPAADPGRRRASGARGSAAVPAGCEGAGACGVCVHRTRQRSWEAAGDVPLPAELSGS